MKIAYIVNKGDTMGGFPQHAELSVLGLKNLGHDVDFMFLDYYSTYRTDNDKKIKEKPYEISKGVGTGLPFHPKDGWWIQPINYKGEGNIRKLKLRLETYDAVFWHTPFWFKQKKTLMDTGWLELFKTKNPKNIIFVHDANLRANSSWQLMISRYIDYVINVHPASYNSCEELPIKRTLIPNPQLLDEVDYSYSAYKNLKKDNKYIFSAQYWKGSKRVDELIRAIPYIEGGVKIAGKGMEYHYMFGSEEKMKEKYFFRKKEDPICRVENTNIPIGKRAMDTGRLELLGWINQQEMKTQMKGASFFIDTAWYKVNLKLGSHFSRTLIESMMQGVVPIARNLGLSGNYEGIGDFFVSGVNYIMIPHDSTPEEFSNIVNEAYNMSEEEYDTIVKNNYKLLQEFEVMNIAKQYEDVINGLPTGTYEEYKVGTPSKEFLKKSTKQFFGNGASRSFNFKPTEEDISWIKKYV